MVWLVWPGDGTSHIEYYKGGTRGEVLGAEVTRNSFLSLLLMIGMDQGPFFPYLLRRGFTPSYMQMSTFLYEYSLTLLAVLPVTRVRVQGVRKEGRNAVLALYCYSTV